MYIFGGSKYLFFLSGVMRKLGQVVVGIEGGLGSFVTSLHRSSFFVYKDSAMHLLPCEVIRSIVCCKLWTEQNVFCICTGDLHNFS